MRYLDVPYFKQDTLYTCGPTSLQMVFAYYGIRESEEGLATEVDSDADVGTQHREMVAAVTRRGLHAYVNDNATLDEVAYLVNDRETPSLCVTSRRTRMKTTTRSSSASRMMRSC